MPGYRGHSVGGVLAALGGLWVIVRFFPSIIIDAPYILIAFFSAFVGARLPDLDIKSASRAFGTRVLLILSLCLLCAGYWHSAGLVLITTAAVYFVRHRGITHSLLFWILILFLVYNSVGYTPLEYQRYIYCALLFVSLGIVSHILLDRIRF